MQVVGGIHVSEQRNAIVDFLQPVLKLARIRTAEVAHARRPSPGFTETIQKPSAFLRQLLAIRSCYHQPVDLTVLHSSRAAFPTAALPSATSTRCGGKAAQAVEVISMVCPSIASETHNLATTVTGLVAAARQTLTSQHFKYFEAAPALRR